MKKYEIMYILNPELDEAARKGKIDSTHAILTKNGASIDDVSEWGLRDLAYEIKKVKKAYYVVIKLSSEDSKCIDEFIRLTGLDSNVLRSLVTVLD